MRRLLSSILTKETEMLNERIQHIYYDIPKDRGFSPRFLKETRCKLANQLLHINVIVCSLTLPGLPVYLTTIVKSSIKLL